MEQKETTAKKKSESADNKVHRKNKIKKEEAKNGERVGENGFQTIGSTRVETGTKARIKTRAEAEQARIETRAEAEPTRIETRKPQHTHTWQEKTHTVNHPEVGHNEQYVVKEAWTETVTEDVYDPWDCCNVCGADCTADPSGHMKQHALAGEGGGWHTEYYKTVTRTVEHPAEYGTRYVVDTPAWTETVSDGFFCTGCGAKK